MQKKEKKVDSDAGSTLSLSPGAVYEGVVKTVDDIRKVVLVKLDGPRSILPCVYAGGVFSSMLGLQTKFLPTKGTRVLVVYGRTSYIMGCIPSVGLDLAAGQTATMTGCGLKYNESEFRKNTSSDGAPDVQTHPYDLLEGELDLSNAMGAGVRLLTFMASINAGDRAKVEACLTNDMVRIVSDTFRHYTAFGQKEVYNDGRLNARFDGTAYPAEAAGVKDGEEKVKMNGEEANLKQIIGETGRWRYSEYLGFLGDFITHIVTDPTQAVGDYAANVTRAGKARHHINSDGTILMQSVAEIVLERVVRIPVPIERKRPDDPKGNTRKDFEQLEEKYLKIWEYGTAPVEMAKTCYQLREYARWLSNYHAYARFHQLEKDWRVPTEAASPKPTLHNEEKDKKAAVQQEFLEVYATIRIMRDGSIVVMDGYGSGITIAQGDLQMYAARNLRIESAGDMILESGGDIHLNAGMNLSMSAIQGGFLAKARNSFKALCELGPIWLKSDMDPEADPPETADPADDLRPCGIFLDAIRSDAEMRSGRRAAVTSTGSQETDGVELNSTRRGIKLTSQRHIKLVSLTGKVLIKAFGVAIDAYKFLSKAFQHVLGEGFTMTAGRASLQMLDAQIIRGFQVILGPEMPRSADEHENHIATLDDSAEFQVADTEDDDLEALENETTPQDTEAIAERTWNYPPETAYGLSRPELWETSAQRFAREHPEDYEPIFPTEYRLKPAQHTGENYPWPGKNAKFWQHKGGESLNKPSAKSYDSMQPKATNFTKEQKVLWALKLKEQ